MYMSVGREDERASLFVQLFHRSNLKEREPGGSVSGGSLQSAAALFVRMPAGRLGERSKIFFLFELPPFSFFQRGLGVRFWSDLYPRLQRVWFARKGVERASALKVSLT